MRLAKTSTSETLPLARAHWDQPSDEYQVFYLQRDMNRNTVVYAARFESDGLLKTTPIEAYWRRYEEKNQTKPLKMVEKLFAYGVKSRKNQSTEDIWTIDFVALDVLKAEMRQSGPFRAALWASINNREYRLIYSSA